MSVIIYGDDFDTGSPTIIPATVSGIADMITNIQVGLILTGDHNVNGSGVFLELLPPGFDQAVDSADWIDIDTGAGQATMILHGSQVWDDGVGWEDNTAYFADEYPAHLEAITPSIGPYTGNFETFGHYTSLGRDFTWHTGFYDPAANGTWAFRARYFGEAGTTVSIDLLELHICGEGDDTILMLVV